MPISRNVMVEKVLSQIKISTDVATEDIIATIVSAIDHLSQVSCAGVIFFGFQNKVNHFVSPCSVKGRLSASSS